MRKWELIKQSELLEIKSKILLNLFNKKYELKLGEFNNTTGTERVKKNCNLICIVNIFFDARTNTLCRYKKSYKIQSNQNLISAIIYY